MVHKFLKKSVYVPADNNGVVIWRRYYNNIPKQELSSAKKYEYALLDEIAAKGVFVFQHLVGRLMISLLSILHCLII